MFLHTCMFPVCCFRQRTYMGQGFVNVVLNATWTHLCLQFEWSSVGYGFIQRSSFLFLRECFTLVCFTHHWYLLCFCNCVYVFIGVVLDFTNSHFFLCMCRCVHWRFFCVCMCGSVVWNLQATIFSNNFCLCIYIYIYIIQTANMSEFKSYLVPH